jgi:hypothetical protein
VAKFTESIDVFSKEKNGSYVLLVNEGFFCFLEFVEGFYNVNGEF